MLDVPLRIAQWKNVDSEEVNVILNGIHTLNYLHPVAEKYSWARSTLQQFSTLLYEHAYLAHPV